MNEENKPRVSIDTNLVISGTITPHNIPSKIISSWAQGVFRWILTQETFGEIQGVLGRDKFRERYHIDRKKADDFLTNLAGSAEFVPSMPLDALPVHSRDPKDDIFLSCALAGGCDFLVTADKDLLTLHGAKELGKLIVLPPIDFLGRITKI